MKFLLIAGVVAERGVLPHDEGMMLPVGERDSIMNDEGEVNLHAVVDGENQADTNSYKGEDEELERANDQVLRFKQGHRDIKIHRTKSLNNNDLWGTNLLQKAKIPHDEGMMLPISERDSIMDDEGEVNLHAVVDAENQPDTNSYKGENEELEKVNDSVLKWKQGDRPIKIHHSRNLHLDNADLWSTGEGRSVLLQTMKKAGLPHDEGMMLPIGERDSIMDDEGEVNLHSVVDAENQADTNSYKGEDEEMEKANDQILRFRVGHRDIKIHRTKSLNNNDLWGQ